MKEIEVSEIIAYSWECPECGVMHVTDKFADLTCQGCGEQFEVGKII